MEQFHSTHGNIAYQVVGSGAPLIMLHGTPFSSVIWQRFLPVLHHKFTVYTYDLLGYGRSEKVEGDVSLGVQNQVLMELLDHWGVERPLVVAHDFGGATTLRAIVLNGLQLEKLALVDVVALSPWGSPFVQQVREHETVFNQLPDYIHEAMVRAYIQDALYHPLHEGELELLVRPWIGAEGKAAFYRQIAQMDMRYTQEVEDGYGQIDCPTKIIWAREDGWIPIAKGRELQTRIPGAAFAEIPEAGHLVPWDQPERVLGELLPFLEA